MSIQLTEFVAPITGMPQRHTIKYAYICYVTNLSGEPNIGITICTRLFTCWFKMPSVISGGSKCHQPEQCLQKHYRELGFPIFQNSRFNLRNKASRKSLVKITRLTHLLFSNTLLCNNLFLCCACIGPDVGWPAFVKLCRITIYLIQ